MKFKLGQKVKHQGEIRTIYDIDEGYGILALDGDKYIAPNHEENRCIEAKMEECENNFDNAEASGRRDKAAFAEPDGCLNPTQEKV